LNAEEKTGLGFQAVSQAEANTRLGSAIFLQNFNSVAFEFSKNVSSAEDIMLLMKKVYSSLIFRLTMLVKLERRK